MSDKVTVRELIKQIKQSKGKLYMAVVCEHDSPSMRVYKSDVLDYLEVFGGSDDESAPWKLVQESDHCWLSVQY